MTCASRSCSEEFEPKTHNNIYCSHRCKNREIHRRYSERHPEVVNAINRRQYAKNKSKIRARLRRRRRNDDKYRGRVLALSRDSYYRVKYGITAADRDKMLQAQHGKCANRGCKNVATHIDHDHLTGRVRGMLCNQCNQSLGLLKEDIDRISGLRLYLEGA